MRQNPGFNAPRLHHIDALKRYQGAVLAGRFWINSMRRDTGRAGDPSECDGGMLRPAISTLPGNGGH
jgi:hypothetical protein